MFTIGKKAALLVAAGTMGAGLLAPAVLSPSTAFAGTQNYRLNAVGSDTIFCVDNKVKTAYNNAQKATTGNQVLNTPPVLIQNIGCEKTPSTFAVPADSVHGKIVYNCVPATGGTCVPGSSPPPSGNLPPDGSSAGISALVADNGAGNIAYSRSSRGRGSADPSNIDFWAFALDAVTWAGYSGGHAPGNLTAAQINAIYTCKVTNWSQVGGSSGTIKRFYPQPGSGTGAFFASEFLGGVYPSNSGSCASTYVEENDGTQVPSAAKPDAILPYSYAVYTAQGNSGSGETNLHGGATLRKVNGTAATATTISESAAFSNISGDACTGTPVKSQFCASRYVYHVTDQQLKAKHSKYAAAIIAEVGVPATGGSSGGFCDNKYSSAIKTFGFKPLALKTTAQSTSSDPVSGKSYCRQF